MTMSTLPEFNPPEYTYPNLHEAIEALAERPIHPTHSYALYTNADGSRELVVLDGIDTVYEVLAPVTDLEAQDVLRGRTKVYVAGHRIELPHGDTFRRLAYAYNDDEPA